MIDLTNKKIKIFRLVTGENIIAILENYTLNGYDIYFPLVVSRELDEEGDQCMMCRVWIPFASNQHIHLKVHSVMCELDCDEDMIGYYRSTVDDNLNHQDEFKTKEELDVEFEPESDKTLYLEDDKNTKQKLHPGFRKVMPRHKM